MSVSAVSVEERLQEIHARHAGRGSAASVAYWAIRDAVRTGVFLPGARLIEVDLAAAFGMSRTPVREALRQLASERLIAAAPSRGYVVPVATIEALVELYEIRGVLEGLAAARAAQRMGPAELSALRETVERMEAARASDDLTLLSTASRQFHGLLHAGSRHSRLGELILILGDTVPGVAVHEWAPDRVGDAVGEHRAIYDAIAAHDSEQAERLTRLHSENALRAQLVAHHLSLHTG